MLHHLQLRTYHVNLGQGRHDEIGLETHYLLRVMRLIFHGERAFHHGDLILLLLALTYPLPR